MDICVSHQCNQCKHIILNFGKSLSFYLAKYTHHSDTHKLHIFAHRGKAIDIGVSQRQNIVENSAVLLPTHGNMTTGMLLFLMNSKPSCRE
jgi:hypothetical protein